MDNEIQKILDDALSMKLFNQNVNPHPSRAWFQMATEEEIAQWQSADPYLVQVFLERKKVQKACDNYTQEMAEEEEGIRHEVKVDYDLDKIKEIDIERVTMLTLKKQGKQIVAQCMWHDDRHPSLVLYGSHYHCYSCGAHGSVIDWCMQEFDFTFLQTLKFLDGYIR